MRLLTLLLVPLAFLALLASGEEKGEGRRISYDGHRLLRVEVGDGRKAELVRAMEARGLGQWRDIRGGSADLVLAPGEEGEAMLLTLERAGLEYQVVAEDLGRLHRLERLAIERRREESRDGGDDRQVDFDIFNFHRHDEINQYLFDLAEEYSDFVSAEIIGQTYEGRDMVVLKICSRGECGANPVMWIDAGIHAREWIGPSSAIYMIDHLVQTLPEDEDDLVDDIDWVFLPVVNPDGYEYTWDFNRDWRKTRQIYEDSLCVGADPNRNYGFEWGGSGSSPFHCSELYHGPEPWSEVEVANVRDAILAQDNVVYFQGLHSAAQLIMYPWGYTCTLVGNDDAEDQDEVAQRANAALYAVMGTEYEVGPICSTIYQTAGDSVDWAYGDAGIKYSFTNELKRGSHPDPFLVDPEDIEPNGLEMMAFHTSVARDMMAEFGN